MDHVKEKPKAATETGSSGRVYLNIVRRIAGEMMKAKEPVPGASAAMDEKAAIRAAGKFAAKGIKVDGFKPSVEGAWASKVYIPHGIFERFLLEECELDESGILHLEETSGERFEVDNYLLINF